MTELHTLSAAALAGLIGAGRVSPVAAVEAMIDRIARLDPTLHAFTEVFADDARLAAEGAERAIRSGHAVGPLHGVPVVLKDLIDLRGRITMGGSAAYRDRRAAHTATVARRLIAQGMIVLGKTHTVEFAYGGWGTNPRLGTPRNPWDPEVARTPGGSSSGTGVAVAARMAPWGLGTDTGGSVRLPAAFCGLTGLKVTVGRVSTHGIAPLAATFDTPGPLARTVEDAALLYEAMAGPDPLDPLTRGVPPVEPWSPRHRGVRGLRLARMPEAEREGVAPAMLAAYDAALAVLEGEGATLVEIALPFRFADFLAMSAVTNAEAYFVNRALAEDPAAPLGEAVRARVLAGASVTAQDYLATQARRAELGLRFAEAMEGIDALLTPTTETAAIPLAEVDEDHLPARFTRFGNLLGLCALALPDGFTEEGLPLSLQIVCRSYDEATALRVGHAYQQATDWHRRLPPA
ncbi:amidase [Methylobacterium aerolatum]|uniref:Indoleacetamide hydrolase n=1 Tax=Methylobacterium aerolatum TaxID=418708 RepID=A0ABU0I3M1_9HYPH|nr:amidase [Methylobacterium aerolatum]MDQ0448677.1 aspartyl-tRNA(Asn)/glutamyl-tRNA(Gln) amidotransferase subunit A [Methylobacterium aerolatum]GJD37261.1 Putative amidase AmiD [Methylobacterium aerolatum]